MPDSEKPTLLLIDGHSLAFRAFYALPIDSFTTRDGQHTNAIHGFISMLLLLLQQQKPTHLAVAFDVSRESFRTREYAEYKGTRGETPPEFKGQIPLLQEALGAMGVQILTKEDFEADDILATLASRGAADGFRVLVASGDRDTLQLVTDDVTVLYPNVRGVSELKTYDADAVRERYGIEPAQYPEIAALVGESSDNLIGIDKVGEKTAVKWIQQYGTVDNLLAHADEITGVVGQNLRDQRDRAVLNRRLNALRTDVELDYGPADLARQPIDAPAVRDLFDRLQFKTLLDRVFKIEGAAEDQALLEEPTATTSTAPEVVELSGDALAAWLAERADTPVGVRVATLNGRIDSVGLATQTESVDRAGRARDRRVPRAPGWPRTPQVRARVEARGQAARAPSASSSTASSSTATSAPGCCARRRGSTPSSSLIYYYLGETLSEPDPEPARAGDRGREPGDRGLVHRAAVRRSAGQARSGLARGLARHRDPARPGARRAWSSQGVTVSAPVLAELNSRLGSGGGRDRRSARTPRSAAR